MLVFLLLCAFLQTLWGKPLPPPLGPSFEVTANVARVTTSEQCPAAPNNWCQQLRSVYDIVQSCLLTIFACVWTSIHPNINGPRDSWWTRTKRRVVTTLYALIAPEMILLWALQQRSAAKRIANEYNARFPKPVRKKTSILQKIQSLFRPLPKKTTWRGDGQLWTTTHGFFIQMGGFILYEKGYPTQVLDYKRLVQLLDKNAIDAPTVTERDLQDRSKGDTISKGIVVLQTTWFVFQSVVRIIQHLPLSELEVVTLAFAVMNAAIYAAWWNKPQGVDAAICVPMKNLETTADDTHSPSTRSSQTDNPHSFDNQPLMQPDEHIDEQHNWLSYVLQKDYNSYTSPAFFLIRLPYRIFVSLLRPFKKMVESTQIQNEPRMAMFYSAYETEDFGTPERIVFITGLIFGSIHLLGWSLQFPSPRDRTLWQISAIVLTAAPLMFLAGEPLYTRGTDRVQGLGIVILLVFTVLIPFYIAARFVVIVIALKAILHPPHDILLDISWTRYIPHF